MVMQPGEILGYRLDDQEVGVQFLASARYFLISSSIQSESEAHLDYNPMSTRGSPQGTAARARN
jgi:hypothetical protein